MPATTQTWWFVTLSLAAFHVTSAASVSASDTGTSTLPSVNVSKKRAGMRIREHKDPEPRAGQVKFGENSHGRRRLIRAVMERGFTYKVAAKAVDTIVQAWTRAIIAKEQHIEMPIGHLKVKKTPSNLYRKRYATKTVCGKPVPKLVTWTIYNDLYRILWRVPPAEWETLLGQVNHENHPGSPDPGSPERGA